MTEIINLRRARKQKARQTRKAAGDANAARHGEVAAARDLRQARTELETRRLESARLDVAQSDGPPSDPSKS